MRNQDQKMLRTFNSIPVAKVNIGFSLNSI